MSSKRVVTKFDFATGEVTETRRIGTLEERFEGLEAQAQEQLSESLVQVLCDGCGLRVEVQEPTLPEGWVSTHAGELCPHCHWECPKCHRQNESSFDRCPICKTRHPNRVVQPLAKMRHRARARGFKEGLGR